MTGRSSSAATVALVLGAVVAVLGVAGCGAPSAVASAKKDEPAKVEPVGTSGLKRLTLTPEAVRRLAIQTAPVTAEPGGRTAIPYHALLYLPSGTTVTYTNPQGTSYQRHDVTVESIDGERVVLTSGPPVGTPVAIAGQAELWGTEFGVK